MKIMNTQILLMICHIHRQQESTVITNHIGKTTYIGWALLYFTSENNFKHKWGKK